MYEKILVPIDGSKPSLNALKHAVNLAKIHNSQINIISVIEELKLPFGAEYRLWANQSHQELIRTSLESINKEIVSIHENEPHIRIDSDIIEGNPGRMIIQESEKGGYDLIVMGKRGMGVVEELIMGNITLKVINKSKIPVTVVA